MKMIQDQPRAKSIAVNYSSNSDLTMGNTKDSLILGYFYKELSSLMRLQKM